MHQAVAPEDERELEVCAVVDKLLNTDTCISVLTVRHPKGDDTACNAPSQNPSGVWFGGDFRQACFDGRRMPLWTGATGAGTDNP